MPHWIAANCMHSRGAGDTPQHRIRACDDIGGYTVGFLDLRVASTESSRENDRSFWCQKSWILLPTDHFRSIILTGDFIPERALIVHELDLETTFSKGNPQ